MELVSKYFFILIIIFLLVIGIVDIFGGYGNQLFQICFALYLKKNGYNPYLYTFGQDNNEDHNIYMVENEDYNLRKINNSSQNLLRKIKKINIIDKSLFTVLKQDATAEIKNLNFPNKKMVTSFNGFWQDKYFVDEVFEEFKFGLLKNKVIKESLEIVAPRGSTMVHIRRADFPAYLPLNYYKDAISKACLVDNFSFDIITDDPEWVKSCNEFRNANNIYGPSLEDDIKTDTINTFANMLRYENYIISNSTYSWWAAKIGEKKNSLVYYPFPHFPGYQPDIYYKNWIKVDHMYSDKWSQDSKPYLL